MKRPETDQDSGGQIATDESLHQTVKHTIIVVPASDRQIQPTPLHERMAASGITAGDCERPGLARSRYRFLRCPCPLSGQSSLEADSRESPTSEGSPVGRAMRLMPVTARHRHQPTSQILSCSNSAGFRTGAFARPISHVRSTIALKRAINWRVPGDGSWKRSLKGSKCEVQ
jgi:hypothetical protein